MATAKELPNEQLERLATEHQLRASSLRSKVDSAGAGANPDDVLDLIKEELKAQTPGITFSSVQELQNIKKAEKWYKDKGFVVPESLTSKRNALENRHIHQSLY